jgi:3-oxoacyl-[acyl-carrier protein] reductase
LDKRALVTGGSGTIGKAISHELARQGLHIIVHANRHPERAIEVCNQISQAGGSAESISFDITDAEVAHGQIENILERGPIQVIVCNAGIHEDVPMAGMSFEQWAKVINVSLHGFFNVVQPLLLPMLRTRWGRIITISSISGVMGNRGQTNYAAAKAGLHGASKSLARECASRGVTVNVVAPGLIKSSMTENAFSSKKIEELVPMKRVGTPEEVAYLVGFLASERANYISGQVIGIDGAMT